jgi:hypothetical protein
MPPLEDRELRLVAGEAADKCKIRANVMPVRAVGLSIIENEDGVKIAAEYSYYDENEALVLILLEAA